MSNLTNNTSELRDILAAVNALPEAGGGGITPSGTIEITKNGTYDVTNYASAEVNVPSDEPNIQPLSVTENGTYTPSGGVDGYGPVTVNVPSGGGSGGSGVKTCTIKIVNECVNNGLYVYDISYNYVVNGEVDVVCTGESLHDTSPEIILDNVLCGSYVRIKVDGYPMSHITLSNNCAELLCSQDMTQFKAPTEAGAVGIVTASDAF